MIGTDSDQRVWLTSALTAPPGYTLDRAVVLTYSLDLATLLALPAHIALGDDASRAELLANPIRLLRALEAARGKILVFCDAGSMLAPRVEHVLYSLLEPVIHEVKAPLGGSFHPKVWIVRFRPESGDRGFVMRMIVSSRNLTQDQSWDLAVTLDGAVGGKIVADNGPIQELVNWVASTPTLDAEDRAALVKLGDDLRRTTWETPPPWESMQFEVLGLTRRKLRPGWREKRSDEMVIISPFIDDAAIAFVSDSCGTPAILISTDEELLKLKSTTLASLGQTLVLGEPAITESGEDADPQLERLCGLHAKAYLSKRGWDCEAMIGSANATSRALLGGTNVEMMVRLKGKCSKTGSPASLLDPEHGIGEILVDWKPPADEERVVSDQARIDADKRLEEARDRLARADLKLVCEQVEAGYQLHLSTVGSLDLTGVAVALAWPVTLPYDRASNLKPLSSGGSIELGFPSKALLTTLIAFELEVEGATRRCRLARNLPVSGMPDDRIGAMFESLLENAQGFLAYLRFLLGNLLDGTVEGVDSNSGSWAWQAELDSHAVLESLIRAAARDPERLDPIRKLLAHLDREGDSSSIVPESFRALWAAVEPNIPPRMPKV